MACRCLAWTLDMRQGLDPFKQCLGLHSDKTQYIISIGGIKMEWVVLLPYSSRVSSLILSSYYCPHGFSQGYLVCSHLPKTCWWLDWLDCILPLDVNVDVCLVLCSCSLSMVLLHTQCFPEKALDLPHP